MASIDFDRPGKYPVVLSDALLGKASKEAYTAVRYNHKPDSSSDTAASTAKLQPSSKPSSYDLSLTEDKDNYAYHGVRTSGDGQYVLIFDPAKKHFVLHRIDSTFDMNLVSAPWEQDASVLQSQYPQLETRAQPEPPKKITKATKNVPAVKSEPKRKKPTPVKKKPVREPTPVEEDDDSDNGFTIEVPDAPARYQTQSNYTSVPPSRRSEEISDEDEDAEGEDDDEEHNQDVELLQLPSPANHQAAGMSDEDLELDLEADLEAALEQETAEVRAEAGDESSESEEE